MEEEFKSCPRCNRTMEPGEEVCSYCGCIPEALEGEEYTESMYDSGTLTPGTRPLIDMARTRTPEARIRILLVSGVSAAILLCVGIILRSIGA